MKALEKISNERINENGDKVWLNSVINYIKGTKYGKKNDVSTIIVNGGDPLMMPVSYYE